MSILLAIEHSGANGHRGRCQRRSRTAALLRSASTRIALAGLCAVVACQIIPGDADPSRSGETVKGIPRATHVGEFSGTYQDGLPVYLFPAIRVVGHRSDE